MELDINELVSALQPMLDALAEKIADRVGDRIREGLQTAAVMNIDHDLRDAVFEIRDTVVEGAGG